MEDQDRVVQAKRDVIDFSRRLYERRLVAGRGGNVSVRMEDDLVLITPHGASLGFVQDQDLLQVNLNGDVIVGKGRPSSESRMHLAIYRELQAKAVIHAHPLHATALTISRRTLKPLTFETLFSLGVVQVIPQETPTVVDTAAVVDALRINNVALLRKHGAVTIADSLKDAYFLTELLEGAAEMISTAQRSGPSRSVSKWEQEEPLPDHRPSLNVESEAVLAPGAVYELFSDDHISAICKLVNGDGEAQQRGRATRLTTRLAIRLDDTGKAHNIHLQDGKVVSVEPNEDADFVISGPQEAWRLVFGGKIDPFVAVTQRRLKLRGDLGKLSRWYSPFYRIFELWKLAPVEG